MLILGFFKFVINFVMILQMLLMQLTVPMCKNASLEDAHANSFFTAMICIEDTNKGSRIIIL